MADHPEHRAEDDAFLTDMPKVLGPRVLQTLERIKESLGLEYGGIDFALDCDNNVVVFEANATMIILPPDSDARWQYRALPVERVQRAFEQMLFTRARFSRP
jgi:glutathione synthase/RimK-type ligase-like ATP-grasp enzyme